MHAHLLMEVGRRRVAVAVAHVEETMRPQPAESIPEVPAFVQGVAPIRGRPTPVVSLRQLLGDSPGEPTRLVSLRVGDRRVAVLVDAVLGVRDLDAPETLPPLLADASAIETLSRLDGQLVTVLSAAHLLPMLPGMPMLPDAPMLPDTEPG